MQAKIVRIDKSTEFPKYHSAESAGFDIASSVDRIIKPKELVLLDTGLIIQAPEGHFLLIAARSSLPLKKGLMVSNGIGVVDRDYCGPEDQIRISVYNFRDEEVEVKKGDRLAQGLFLPVDQVEWVEADNIKENSRGGFGSSGGYNG
jgi:dUTP pyrophosphatase